MDTPGEEIYSRLSNLVHSGEVAMVLRAFERVIIREGDPFAGLVLQVFDYSSLSAEAIAALEAFVLKGARKLTPEKRAIFGELLGVKSAI